MLIQIDKLKKQPRQIVVDETVEAFPVLQELVSHGSVSFDEKIHGVIQATWAGDVVEVSGQLVSMVSMACARCLSPVSCELQVDMLLCYSNKDEGGVDVPEEVEIRSEELGLITYEGQEIDLRPDLEQEIIMSLPQHCLCSEACKGLCPVCGINQNLNRCDCEKPVFHSGLAALKNFKLNQ